jgi:hypothetical protein
MFVHIITNSLGSGDWVVVVLEGDVIYEGHSLGPYQLKDILESVNGFEHLRYHELNDEEMENWQEAIWS